MSTLSLIPHISEKAYAESIIGTYIFKVPTTANKAEVIRAVQAKYSVTVTDVRLLNQRGKAARQIRLGGSKGLLPKGKKSDTKKAYVKLKQGDVIKIEAFQEVQAEQATAAAPKKSAKLKSKSNSKKEAKK